MLDLLPVSSVKKYLDKILPQGWEAFETETIVMELGVQPSEILIDKINVLRIFSVSPDMFYNDPMFFLHACEVFNNNVADFQTLPHVTSLEAALAIVDASRVLGCHVVEDSPPFSEGVREVLREILVDDGYSQPIWPFDSVGIVGLSPGATPEDMAKKAKAINEYIHEASTKFPR